MNLYKNVPRKSDRLKSPKWHFPQLALPPIGPRPRLKSPNFRYTKFMFLCNRRYYKGATQRCSNDSRGSEKSSVKYFIAEGFFGWT